MNGGAEKEPDAGCAADTGTCELPVFLDSAEPGVSLGAALLAMPKLVRRIKSRSACRVKSYEVARAVEFEVADLGVEEAAN